MALPMQERLAAERLAIVQRLIELGDRTFDLADNLRQRGYSAFDPYHRFFESFASHPNDVRVHRECVVEKAKVQLGASDRDLGAVYQSTLLERLAHDAKRSPLALDPATRWIADQFADPCEQSAHLFSVQQRSEYQRRESEMRNECVRDRAHEIERFARLAKKPHPFGMLIKSQRFGFASEVIRSGAKSLGFDATKFKASSGRAIASKQLTALWRVSWCIGDPFTFYAAPHDGMLVLNLLVEASDSAVPSPTIQVPLRTMVYGFWFAYGRFSDLDSLEVNLQAHVQMYELIQSEFEDALMSGCG